MIASGLICEVSTIADGNMSLKWGEQEEVQRNRKKFLNKIGIKQADCVFTNLVHGDEILNLSSANKEKTLEADGFITIEEGLAIFMLTGDCLPVVYFDSHKKILGLAHLGWRGTDKRLAGKMVDNLVELGVNPHELKVWIGPGARKDSYLRYGSGVASFRNTIDLDAWQNFLQVHGDKLSVDLEGYVKHQLEAKGVLTENIEVSPVDTIQNENYFSQFRSDKQNMPQGRFATVVMMQ